MLLLASICLLLCCQGRSTAFVPCWADVSAGTTALRCPVTDALLWAASWVSPHFERRFPAPSSNSARTGYATDGAFFISAQLSAFRHLPPNSARIGYATDGALFISAQLSAFRHLPPNSARTGYATDGALFISAQLSTDAVSALRKVRVVIRLWIQRSAQAHT